LNKKSQGISDIANTYKSNTKILENQTKWGNWKWNIAIGGIGGGGLAYLIYALFFK
jgi:hypothetical protein